MAALAALALLAAIPCGQTAAAAELSSDQLINQLEAKPVTRSLFSRGVSVSGGQAEAPPSVDLHVAFEFNSAKLTTDAQLILENLGRALQDARLKDFNFTIAGHTDAVGSDAFNMDLSTRRAGAVRDYLVSRYGVVPARLTAVGYGKSRLANPAEPEGAVNRRVQIINTGQAQAQR
jgi:outer membrane protein OmpA-like peptidoglycan-associated protein